LSQSEQSLGFYRAHIEAAYECSISAESTPLEMRFAILDFRNNPALIRSPSPNSRGVYMRSEAVARDRDVIKRTRIWREYMGQE